MRSDRFALLALIACALVAACGNLPRPFQPDEKGESNRLLILPDRGGVIVLPVAGLPEPIAVGLAERMADALRRENIPATTGEGNRASYQLEGETTIDADGVPVASFELRDPRSTLVKSHRVKLDRSVQGGAGLDLAAIARDAAPVLAAALQPEAVSPPPPRLALRIGEVTGAPGDGGVALARSLGYALRRTGIKVAQTGDADSAVVHGAVTIVPRGPKLRSVAILWTVLAPDGTELGQVRQENDVTQDFIDRAWPEMASAVAEGAAEGLADLIDQMPPAQQ